MTNRQTPPTSCGCSISLKNKTFQISFSMRTNALFYRRTASYIEAGEKLHPIAAHRNRLRDVAIDRDTAYSKSAWVAPWPDDNKWLNSRAESSPTRLVPFSEAVCDWQEKNFGRRPPQCGCNAISKPLALPYELTPCRHAFICVRFGRVTCGRTTRKTNVPMPVWQAKIIRIKAFMYFLYRKSDIFATKP
jgi:hypothetical protein